MKKRPSVSIVTPAYNAMPYLKATIESIRSQEYPDLEHIVMDGGSKDGTCELLRQYPEINWVSEKDRGQSHALNKGFELAKGDIIGWLNADDIYEPDAILTAVEYLEQHPEVDLVCSDLKIIDEDGQYVGVTYSTDFRVEDLLFENKIKQPTVFMRRQVIDRLKGVDEQYHYVMDREFWLRVGMSGFKMHYLEGKIFASFRLCKGTKSFEGTPKFRDEWFAVLQKVKADPFFDAISPSIKKKALDQNRSAYHVAKMMEAIDKGFRKDMMGHFRKAVVKDPKLLLNKGIWLYLYLGVTGASTDRLRKFKKNAIIDKENIEHA